MCSPLTRGDGLTSTQGAAAIADASPRAAALDVQNIVVRFGGIAALDGVSFDVAPGEVRGLIGPNGAGKTTLFDVVSGVRSPDEGTRPPRRRRHHVVVGGAAGPVRAAPNLPAGPDLRLALGRGQRARRARVARRRGRHRWPTSSRRRRAGARSGPDASGSTRCSSCAACGGPRRAGRVAADRPRPHGRGRAGHRRSAPAPPARRADLGARRTPRWRASASRSSAIRARRQCAVLLVEHDVGFVMDQCDRIVVLDLGAVLADGVRPKRSDPTPRYAAAYLGEQ